MITHSFATYHLAYSVGLASSICILKYSLGCLCTHYQNHPNPHVKRPPHLGIFYSPRLVLEILCIKFIVFLRDGKYVKTGGKILEATHLLTSWIHLKTGGTSHESL